MNPRDASELVSKMLISLFLGGLNKFLGTLP